MYAFGLVEQNAYILLPLTALVGAIVGSFLTLVTYRLPKGRSVVATRSSCPKCRRKLQIIDLIPLVSWAIYRGACRRCKKPVGIRYPLIELACALGAVVVVQSYGLTLAALALVGLWWSIVAIIVTDLEHYIILDEVQIATALFGLVYAWALGTPLTAIVLAATAGLALGFMLKYGFLWFAKKDGLGMGDVKFLGVAGIWLSHAESFIPFLFFAGILGVGLGLLWRALGHGERFPFGPALAAALLVCVIWPEIPQGYWQLYGIASRE